MVTIKQIADAVGVSSATVSRVLNFDSTLSVSAQTRKSIVETAEALNYATPRNRNRKSDQTRLGQKIALVHFLRPDQELVDPYYVGIRLGIESRCQALKIETVKVYHTDSMPDASLLHHALFALKHEGVRLGLLLSALRRIPPAELVAWVQATPNSLYGRKLGHLWERLHQQRLQLCPARLPCGHIPLRTCRSLHGIGPCILQH